MAQRRPAASAALLLLAAGRPGPGCLAQSFREELLELARQRNGEFYRDSGNLADQKSAEGVLFSLSKNSKSCAGDGIPLTFLEYDIESVGDVEVRPVDAFNVLSDLAAWPQWETFTDKATFLGDFEQRQARGFATVMNAKPVSNRELYEWLMVDANFTTEEFWVVFTSLDTTALQQRKPADQGTVSMQNCMGATHITKTPTGLHIVSSNQPNAHSFPLDPRTVANIGWKDTVDFAVNLRKRTLEHARLHWNATRTVVPKWMLEARPCGAPAPDTELKTEYLAHAARVLSAPESERGTPSSLPLEGGGTLRLWEGRGPCSIRGGSADTVPVWQASFAVPEVMPADVFNVLVNKSNEPAWNAPLVRVNETGFSGGVRGLHEEYSLVPLLAHRELWEWQAAAHNLTTDPKGGTFLIAIASVANFTEKFARGNVEAAQCMAAYQIAPGPGGGSIVNMTSQFDPNMFGAPWISKLWPKIGQDTLKNFADGLINQSRWLASVRARGAAGVQADGGVLALLAPAPPGRNVSATLASVLVAGSASARLRLFADLDLPALLNASSWAPGEFPGRAAELLRVFELVRANATAAENATFLGGAAADVVALQLQGLAVASVQGRVLGQLAEQECHAPPLPDIDGNKSTGGLTLMAAAVLCVVVVVLACAGCGLCCARWKKLRRERMAHVAAAALLSGAGASVATATAAAAPGRAEAA